ncbi:MAG: uncharacterized membrane protein YbaN (DUF454 family) [Pseudohongiellaceae bacterium]|jgi:uncharacterized membrane protein YbaN (DUF454 family)
MISRVKQTAGKILGFVLILVFIALGILGILLPILPGLVFLLIAALIATRHFPALAFLLEQNRYARKCLRISNSFVDLGYWDKARLCFWGMVKISVDGVSWSVRLANSGGRFLIRKIDKLAL